jgi:hypothetical protein
MGTGAVRLRGRVAGFGAISAIAAAAVAGCGAASSGTAAATSPSAAAPSSAAASPGTGSAAAAGGGSADATGVVQLAAKTASSASSVTGTLSLQQATVKAGAAAASPAASAGASGTTGGGDLSLSGTFAERVRPSLLVSATISTLRSAGVSVPGGLSEILTPSTLYQKAPALTRPLHIAKPWLSVPLATLGQSTGVDFSQMLNSVSSNGPLAQSQLLAGATSVQKTGTTTLGGVPVTEYTGTTDLRKAAAALSGSSKTALQQAMAKTGLTTATFTVWIDASHVTRKAVVHETGKTITETVTTTITSINQPVNIAIPAAGQTAPQPTGTTTPATSTS